MDLALIRLDKENVVIYVAKQYTASFDSLCRIGVEKGF
jgi:hypothetical protein